MALGTLERIPGMADRRVVMIGVTKKGRTEVDEAHAVMTKVIAQYFSRLCAKDRKTITRSHDYNWGYIAKAIYIITRAGFKTSHFGQSLRWAQISILEIPYVFLRLKFSPALTLTKLKRFEIGSLK